MLRRLFTLAALFTMLWTSAEAQVTAPYTFSAGTVILSAEVNANFAMLGDALNRTGGTMTGSLTAQVILPDGDNTRNFGSAAASWASAWFDGTVTMATAAITTLTCTGCVSDTQLASTTVSAASYGSASGVGTFTVDADGRLTAASTTAIAIAATQVTSGNYVATVTAGSGIAVGTGTGTGSTPAFSLTALTADWTQSGAYNIVLAHASAGIKILESTGDTYYGILDVGDLAAADATYTFSGTSGTVYTSANDPLDTIAEWQSLCTNCVDADGDLSGTTLKSTVVSTSITSTGTVTSGTWSASFGDASLTAIDAGTWTGATSITTLGTVATGTWNASFTDASLTAIDAGTWTGASSITTLGTITTGVWNAGSVTSSGGISGTTGAFSSTLTLSGTAANIALGSNYLSGDGGDEGILVGSAGNVSIGINTDPDKQLYVYKSGAVTAASDFAVQAQNATTNTTTDGISKFGVYALSLGTFTGSGGAATTAYGIYASAADADVNWAGYFAGNIKITGTGNEVGTITSGVWNAGAVTSSGAVTGASGSFTGDLVVHTTTTGNKVLTLGGSPSDNSGASIALLSSNTNYNWWVRGSWSGDQFELSPSTAAGGSAAATPIFTLSPAGVLTLSALASGDLTSASGVITSSSDERLKDIVGPLDYGLAEVLQLRPIRYHWNAASGIPTGPAYGGFGAAQVEQSMPLAVAYDAKGIRSLNTRVILGAVVNGMREVDARLQSLEAQVAALAAQE